jgi:hypothetical protein
MSPNRADDRPAGAPADRGQEAADAGRFVRGLTIGLIVGAVIAGSTLWRRFGSFRTRP